MDASVLYRCSCAGTPGDADAFDTSCTSPSAGQCCDALAALYYCDGCAAVRCNECVAWEVSSFYCPACLFEVTASSAKAQRGRYAVAYAVIF